ncbi:MAG: response regulator transcription factor, partial [Gammaproteobacteria bacterium]|nr:response regulator transcription factor [Gammaproteobacteria bacterium]
MKILLVDDHAVVRHGYASLLQACLPEVQVEHASSGEEALQCMPSVNPHLLIM